MNNNAVEIRNLRRRFGSFELAIPEFTLERGKVLGLVGQNGAGKSTLLKILMNLVYPDTGEVRVLGRRQPEDEVEIKQRIGYVSENPQFYDQMTVRDLAKMVSGFYPRWDWNAYSSYLQKFCLDSTKKVKDLSRGMKVKLALLLAMSYQPDLLILDEPTSGIDPVMRRELLEEIVSVLSDEEKTVIFSSHITQDVEQIADYVAVLKAGRLVEYADRENLLDRWRQVQGKLISGDPVQVSSLFVRYQMSGNEFFGVTRDYSSDLLQKLQALQCQDLKVHPATLETVLLSIAGKGEAAHVVSR